MCGTNSENFVFISTVLMSSRVEEILLDAVFRGVKQLGKPSGRIFDGM
jgi:hypothetical protein